MKEIWKSQWVESQVFKLIIRITNEVLKKSIFKVNFKQLHYLIKRRKKNLSRRVKTFLFSLSFSFLYSLWLLVIEKNIFQET